MAIAEYTCAQTFFNQRDVKMRNQSRLISTNLSDDKGFAALSTKAQVLFLMIIPHLNPYGKMCGGVGSIKDTVCPRIAGITTANLPKLLHEISKYTSIKWFEFDGRSWIHATRFGQYQKLRNDRSGPDMLPDYSGTTPGELPPEEEEEVEEEEEEEGKPAPVAPAYVVLGEFENVKLTENEIAKLNEKFGAKEARDRINSLSEYMKSKRKRYDSHYATILNWARRDEKQSAETGKKPTGLEGVRQLMAGKGEVVDV